MRSRVRLAAVAAALSVVAGLLPSGAGQHFGLIGGRAMTVGSSGAAHAGSDGMTVPVEVKGFFVSGLDVTRSQPSGQIGVFTISGCIQIMTARGMDQGCVKDLRVPEVGDPLLMHGQVNMQIPSSVDQRHSIHVQLLWDGGGDLQPGVRFDYDPNPNDPDVRLKLTVARNATVTGSVVSTNPMVGGGPVTTIGSIGIIGCLSFAPPTQDTDAFATCP